jgi:hypothetical protein
VEGGGKGQRVSCEGTSKPACLQQQCLFAVSSVDNERVQLTVVHPLLHVPTNKVHLELIAADTNTHTCTH